MEAGGMTAPVGAAMLLLQSVPPRALVFAMALSYVLCCAGMLFAYLAYRRRKRIERERDEDKR